MKVQNKNSNPFYMLGSWIGLIIGIIIAFFIYSAISVLCDFGSCKPTAYFLPLVPIVLGFLIGWGIHGLIRRLI